MISVSKKIGAALLALLLAAPAYAQVCMEAGGSASGKANMNCDMTYRNQLVTCDTVNTTDIAGTRPSCPEKPMPMIDTPNKSYIQDYNPYLWQYPRAATDTTAGTDPSMPYSGAYALGTPGDASRTFQIFGDSAPGTQRLAACTTQIHVPMNPTTNGEWAKLIRLQVDNCTNQYLLNAAVYPVQKDSSKILSGDDPTHPSKTLSVAGECQPLKTFTETENEYDAGHYLKVAWQKLLQDPGYRVSTPTVAKCTPCVGGLELCDHEPHLPCQGPSVQGLTIDNSLAPLSTFPEVRLSTLSTVKYENINDPSHPFSPRWDFLLNDRDYSNLDDAQLTVLSPAAEIIKQALGIYMSKTDNAVFCAGVRTADNETDSSKKADDTVRVDVMSFRKNPFETALGTRTVYNSLCYENIPPNVRDVPEPTSMTIPELAELIAGSWCYHINSFYMAGTVPMAIAYNKHCWECFGLSGQIDDISQHPPCTTQYLGSDHNMVNMSGGGYNLLSTAPQCGSNFPKVCSDLRRPYTNMNILKMRYHRTDDPQDTSGNNNALKNGAAEGMTFKGYFGNHMPYPRIWDMGGVSLQMSPATDMKNQPPTDTTGQYTAIVGIGREGAAGASGSTAVTAHPDQRCLSGGWVTPTTSTSTPTSSILSNSNGGPATGTVVTFGGLTLTAPDPLTSWTEMKLYEARTLRNIGMSCIGRYEKVFKPGSGENMMLLKSGGTFEELIVNKCSIAKGITSNCTTMSYKDFIAAGNPANTDSIVYMKYFQTQNYPQPWRGYMSAGTTANQFPTWPGDGSASTGTAGLDNALLGDIIELPNGPKDDASSGNRGLAKLAFVIETRLAASSDCAAKKDCYVRVLEADNGKWPDSCGTTDTWGEMKTRYYYQPGDLPPAAKLEYTHISSTTDCVETKISHCEMNAWSTLKVYHIAKDTRKGCTQAKAASCGSP